MGPLGARHERGWQQGMRGWENVSMQWQHTEERVELLAEREAESRKHGNTAVLELCLAVEAHLALSHIVGGAVAERIEEVKRTSNTRHRLHDLKWSRRRRRLLNDCGFGLHFDVQRRAHREGSGRNSDDGKHDLL